MGTVISAQPETGKAPAVSPSAQARGDDTNRSGLAKEILVPAAVVVAGATMTVLDATVVNVALPTLGHDLHTQVATVQWIPTAYLLAFASVIPLSGWAAARFGVKRVGWPRSPRSWSVRSWLASRLP